MSMIHVDAATVRSIGHFLFILLVVGLETGLVGEQ